MALDQHQAVVTNVAPARAEERLALLVIRGVDQVAAKQHDAERSIEGKHLDSRRDAFGTLDVRKHLGRLVNRDHRMPEADQRVRHSTGPGAELQDIGTWWHGGVDDLRFVARRQHPIECHRAAIRSDVAAHH